MITKTAFNMMKGLKGLARKATKLNPESVGVEMRKVKQWGKAKSTVKPKKINPSNIGIPLDKLPKKAPNIEDIGMPLSSLKKKK